MAQQRGQGPDHYESKGPLVLESSVRSRWSPLSFSGIIPRGIEVSNRKFETLAGILACVPEALLKMLSLMREFVRSDQDVTVSHEKLA
jgi:hypothetical protein